MGGDAALYRQLCDGTRIYADAQGYTIYGKRTVSVYRPSTPGRNYAKALISLLPMRDAHVDVVPTAEVVGYHQRRMASLLGEPRLTP